MLVFVIPLQSAAASKDWALVSRLCIRTIRSVAAQRGGRFKIVFVCTEVPDGFQPHDDLIVVERKLAAPTTVEGRMDDKWTRVRIGLFVARQFAPCHIMVVDADDCVSNRLARFCEERPEERGWYFDSGWMHDERSPLIFRWKRGFHAVCGTSSIVRVQPEDLPDVETGGRDDNLILRSGHTKIRANMESAGTPLAPLPFPGAVYNLATGENHTGFSLSGWRSKKILIRKLFGYRLLTQKMREEFGLYDL
jgi:hypothetical protein